MTNPFKKATKSQSRARVAFVGPSGSGKTWSALKLARELAGPDGTIAVIDTERGSASLYAGDVADFDVLELESYAPHAYIEALRAAGDAGYSVVVVDSLSHAWAGKDGVLEIVDNAAARSRSNNKFAAWREGTPQQHALVDALLQSRMHLVCTMRAKTEYVLEEDEKGRKVPRKIGLAPVQRDQIEYEFTVTANLEIDHTILVDKTRCGALDRAVLKAPGNVEKLGATLREWLTSGAPMVDRPLYSAQAQTLLDLLGKVSDPVALESARASTGKVWSKLAAAEKTAIEAAGIAAAQRVREAQEATGWVPEEGAA